MSNESSSTENATTTTSTTAPTQTESAQQGAQSVQQGDITSQTLTRYAKEESSKSSEISGTTNEKDGLVITEDPSEPTPNELVNLGRPPYIVDLMKARLAYETFDVKETMSEIDTYIRDGLQDSRASYEHALNGILNNINQVGDIYTDIKQLKDYVRIQNKIKEAIKEKEDFEAKDPLEMTSEELKRLLNDRH